MHQNVSAPRIPLWGCSHTLLIGSSEIQPPKTFTVATTLVWFLRVSTICVFSCILDAYVMCVHTCSLEVQTSISCCPWLLYYIIHQGRFLHWTQISLIGLAYLGRLLWRSLPSQDCNYRWVAMPSHIVHLGAEDLNSDPYISMATVLLIELPPRFHDVILSQHCFVFIWFPL